MFSVFAAADKAFAMMGLLKKRYLGGGSYEAIETNKTNLLTLTPMS